jgi:hypothetical protein
MVRNALQHMAQVRIRINAIELAGANQAVNHCGTVATTVGAEVQVVLASLAGGIRDGGVGAPICPMTVIDPG